MFRLGSTHLGVIAGAALPLLGLLTLGCGASNDAGQAPSSTTPSSTVDGVEVQPDLKAVPTPPGGLALYSPTFTVKAGEDVTYCTYTDTLTDEDLFVHNTTGRQTKFGHHAILFYTTTPVDPHTDQCTGQTMETLSQLIGGTGGEGMGNFSGLPPNVGTILPKGSQLVLQTHWINTSADTIKSQAMMVTIPGPDTDRVVLGTVVVVNLGFNVPARSAAESSAECVVDQDHQLLTTLGHEHEWGTHVRADVTRVADGHDDVLFDRSYSPTDVFEPPIDMYTLDKPLTLLKGDTLKMDCQWQNDLDTALTFPKEMCVFFSYSLEPGDTRCIGGSWIRSGAAVAPATDGTAAPVAL